MKKKKILIAGSSGFIGTNICKLIPKYKYNICGTYYKKKKFKKFNYVKYFKSDLRNLNNCKKITKNMDVVIMCAANSSGANVIVNSPIDHFTPNVIMNTNILQACHENNVKKFIFLSSNTVYPNTKKVMKEIDSKYSFFNKYHIVAWMKKFAEISCEIFSQKIKSNLSCLIVRPSNLYGPYDKFSNKEAKVIPALIKRTFEKRDPFVVWGDGKDLKDFLYVDDFVKGIIKLIEYEKKFEIINFSYGKSVSIKKVLKYIFKIMNHYPKIEFDLKKPTLIKNRFINNSKAFKKLNWKPKTQLPEGLKKTINWYKPQYTRIK